MPAGRKRSRERTGIIKQSCSRVDREIGSLRELTKAPVPGLLGCPLKLTATSKERHHIRVQFIFLHSKRINVQMFFHVPANVQLSCSASAADMHCLKSIPHSMAAFPKSSFFSFRKGEHERSSVTLTLLHLCSMKYSNTFRNQSESFLELFRTCWHHCMRFLLLCLELFHITLMLIFLLEFFIASPERVAHV